MKILIESNSACFNTHTTQQGKSVYFKYFGKNGDYHCYQTADCYTEFEARTITKELSNSHYVTNCTVE